MVNSGFEKKKLLFVIESLSIGGAEKSLVTLLNLMDYSRYDVDLLLFTKGGAFRSLLPKEVTILDIPDYYKYSSIPWKCIIGKLKDIKKLFAQIRYSIKLRIGKHSNIEKSVLFWKNCSKCFRPIQKEYDVAIAYAQGIPTFFVDEMTNAKKKVAWINVTYIPKGKCLEYIKPKYQNFDYINAVSESVCEQMQSTFTIPDNKTTVIKDILDVNFAHKMADMPSEAIKEMDSDGIKILTVGRLANMKGHELAIDAAKILADKGINYKWFAVGDGPLRQDLEKQIINNKLENQFVLLGSKNNPYPYFKNCDIYVQPSRFEGFGITIAEAKMFGKPIVATDFDVVSMQIANENNGLIVDITPEAIADGILRMLNDVEIRKKCVENLALEKIGNTEEIEKFYNMVEG